MTDSDDPKAALRLSMRARRRALQAEAPHAGVAAAAALAEAPLPRFETAAVYIPHGSEIDAMPLALALERAGVRLALPAVERRNAPLVFRAWRPGDPMHADGLGLPAPSPEAEAVDPELLVVPLLAFDRHGRRLGQGGGYYDRTLGRLRPRGVFAMGLGFAGQEVDELPAGPHDERLDAVLTEAGYRPAEKA